jgi:hypothetical protein
LVNECQRAEELIARLPKPCSPQAGISGDTRGEAGLGRGKSRFERIVRHSEKGQDAGFGGHDSGTADCVSRVPEEYVFKVVKPVTNGRSDPDQNVPGDDGFMNEAVNTSRRRLLENCSRRDWYGRAPKVIAGLVFGEQVSIPDAPEISQLPNPR